MIEVMFKVVMLDYNYYLSLFDANDGYKSLRLQ